MTMTTLTELLNNKPIEAFTASQLGRKAHWRTERGQPYAAFLLFDAAARRARATGEAWRGHRNRAATALFDAGHVEDALPLMEAVLDDYEASPDVQDDRHWVEHVTVRLLRHSHATEPTGFGAAYHARTARASAIQGRISPWIHPFQEELAAYAREHGCSDIVRALSVVMRRRSPMTRPLKRQLDDLDAWLLTQP